MKYLILPMLLALLLIAGQSAAQDTVLDNESIAANATSSAETTTSEETAVNETTPSNLNASESGLTIDINAPAIPDLKYIWSVTGIEPSQITMALNQEGEDLFGQAKYEPDTGEAWNAVVVGSITGDNVDLVLTALIDKELVSTKMKGTFANENIAGKYFRVADGKLANRGEFNSVWINPDITSYSPAKIEETKQETPAQPEVTQNATVQQTNQPVQLSSKSRFVDVREYKDKIGPGGDLSGVPPGMSGFV
jgi:hypothetical protein